MVVGEAYILRKRFRGVDESFEATAQEDGKGIRSFVAVSPNRQEGSRFLPAELKEPKLIASIVDESRYRNGRIVKSNVIW